MEQIASASSADRDEIARLLDSCALPSADIDAHLSRFFVARDDGRIVGCIGLEAAGDDALLRSLAVAPDRRGEGIARRLYARLIGQARGLGVSQLYLLTTGAEPFFEMLGFRAVGRDDVPAAIRSTEQFRSLCPSTATCLSRPVPSAD
jgi:N-acetylglutamate synthase-like GNAT family acetyltransferase